MTTIASVDIAPLSARSVMLSLVLGAHPARLNSADLVRAGEHFGIPAATSRVALTRAIASGDLTRAAPGSGTGPADYLLGPRLAARHRHQEEAVLDAETPWDGDWEMAVVVVTGRSATERSALRERLASYRLAEVREGVWTRPANLRRTREYVGEAVLSTFTARPDEDPAALAAALWDLGGWVDDGRRLLARLESTGEPASRLAVAAALVRHLATDPLLPAALLPSDWPADAMRTAYLSYESDLRAVAFGGR